MRRTTHRKTAGPRSTWVRVVAPLTLATLVAAGGGALSFYQTRKSSTPVSGIIEKVDAKKEALPPHLDGLLPVTSVQELAGKAGGSPVTDVTLQNRNGGLLVYVVTLKNGTKMGFNAMSGNAVSLEDTTSTKAAPEQNTNDLPSDITINTSFEDARKLAQDAFPNGKISQIRLNAEGDSVVLSAQFADNAQVDINAADGTVIRVTTPSGATAAAPSTPSSSTSPAPAANQPNTDQQPSKDDEQSSNADNTTPSGPHGTSSKANGKASLRVEGTLILSNGIYTITENDVTYEVQTDQDISSMVGKTVRVEGTLQTGKIIQTTKIQLQH